MATIELQPKPTGVTRLKRGPVVIALMVFGLVLLYLLLQLTYQKRLKGEEAETTGSHKTVADMASADGLWFEDDKYKQMPVAVSTAQDVSIPSKQGDEQTRYVPMANTMTSETTLPQTNQALKELQEQQWLTEEKLRQEAIRAPAKVPVEQFGQRKDNAPTTGLQQSDTMITAPLPRITETSDTGSQQEKEQFLSTSTGSDDYLPYRKTAMRSAQEVKAGTIIPAALITGLNSDLPGSVTAQVRQPVYDSITGNRVLIPQGTRLIGRYDSRIAYGQNRALVVWDRLIFPDGQSLNIDGMQGTDSGGYAGFHDQVEQHLGRIYGSALLMSLIGSGYELLNQDTGTEEEQDIVAASIGQQLAQVSSEMIRKNLRVQPTVIIRSGYKFNVLVMKDMILDDANNRSLGKRDVGYP